MAANPIPQLDPKQQRSTNPNMGLVDPAVAQQIRNANPRNRSINKKEIHRQKNIRKFVTVASTIIVGAFAWQTLQTGYSLIGVQQQISRNSDTYKTVKSNNADLKAQNKNLKNPEYLSQVLRDKYHYSKNGEVIFNIPESTVK